jgi:hypothetical protein
MKSRGMGCRMAVVASLLAVCIAGIGSSTTNAGSGFPAPSAAPCPQIVTADEPPADKRTDATATCYYLPEVFFSPTSGTVAVNQTFTFTLEVRNAEYGCTKSGAWSGTISTDSSGTYGPQSITVGPFGSTGTYTYSVSCGGLGGTNPGSTTVTVVASGGGGTGSGGGAGCTENTTSQMYAQFVSMSGVPASVVAGQTFTANVTFQNTGACTWTAANSYRLGSQNPENNTTWGASRAYLSASDAIAPGQSKTFTINAAAPSTAGSYGWGWRMVREGVNWLGTPTNGSFTTISVAGSGGGSAPAVTSFATNTTMQWSGSSMTLSWSCTDTSGAAITSSPTSGGTASNLPATGTWVTPALTANQEYVYTLTCSKSGFTAATATLYVGVFDVNEQTIGSANSAQNTDPPNSLDATLNCRWKSETNKTEVNLRLGLRAGGLSVKVDWCVKAGRILRVARSHSVIGPNYPLSQWSFAGIESYGPCDVNCSNYVQLYGTNRTQINIWIQGHWQYCHDFGRLGHICIQEAYKTVGVLIKGDGTRVDTYSP